MLLELSSHYPHLGSRHRLCYNIHLLIVQPPWSYFSSLCSPVLWSWALPFCPRPWVGGMIRKGAEINVAKSPCLTGSLSLIFGRLWLGFLVHGPDCILLHTPLHHGLLAAASGTHSPTLPGQPVPGTAYFGVPRPLSSARSF